MKNKILFIVNPVAGRGRAKKLLVKLKEYLKGNSSNTDIYVTERQGSAIDFVSKLSDKYKIIVAVGGDGTLNEIVNGLDYKIDNILAVLPCGSGNDFVKSLGINKDFEKNIDMILNQPSFISIDLGVVTYYEDYKLSPITNYFINSCGIGFDALVAHLITRNKILVGLPLYLSSVIKALFVYVPLQVEGICDSKIIEGKKLLLSIGNGKTSGGGFVLNPFAELNDNKLDLCVINNFNRFKIIKNLSKAITGKHYKIKGVDLQQFNNFSVSLSKSNYLHIDGEVKTSNLTKVEITVYHNKLKFIKGI